MVKIGQAVHNLQLFSKIQDGDCAIFEYPWFVLLNKTLKSAYRELLWLRISWKSVKRYKMYYTLYISKINCVHGLLLACYTRFHRNVTLDTIAFSPISGGKLGNVIVIKICARVYVGYVMIHKMLVFDISRGVNYIGCWYSGSLIVLGPYNCSTQACATVSVKYRPIVTISRLRMFALIIKAYLQT